MTRESEKGQKGVENGQNRKEITGEKVPKKQKGQALSLRKKK